MSKTDIRDLLIELKPFMKLNTFASMVGISSSALSLFMRDVQHSHMISQEKLDQLVNLILQFMSNFA